MLTSVKLQRRQSEIRQDLAELAAKDQPTEDETRSMETLDAEYRTNETRYRAALISEDEERREAGEELASREGKEWSDILGKYELRQVAELYSNEHGVVSLSGATAEVVAEMRRQNGDYKGTPVPLEALEVRAGETVSSGVPQPMQTAPIVDRLFANTAATAMGVSTINIAQGEREYPVVSSSISAGWADGELADVPGPLQFTTVDKALAPDSTFGVQLKTSRKALKQSGAGLEAAMRRDLSGAIQVGLDRAVFLGSGASGEPLGIIPGAATYGITVTAIDAEPSYATFRAAALRFILNNAANGPGGVRLMLRPEVFDDMDGDLLSGTAVTEWDRLVAKIGGVTLSHNALIAPTGDPATTTALMTTSAGGLPPAFMALWGGVDLIRDVYSDAKSGALRMTGLVTADVTVARGAQLEILTGLQAAA